ncbi:MAG TPA: hypothetical protein VFW32_09185 [Actinomycetes bacterium]|nr:hypothetical protein [Actinomycetes bacterium]
MLFSNLLVAIALTVLFPLGLMGVLAASEWLERRTLAAEEVLPRRLRRMDGKPPEAVEAMVLEETAHVVAEYWSATGRPVSQPPAGGASSNGAPPQAVPAPANGGGRHLRRATPGRAGRHERRR